MPTKLAFAVSFLSLASLITCGCGPSVNPNQGFTIQTDERVAAAGCSPNEPCPPALLGPPLPLPGVPVSGDCQWGLGSVGGSPVNTACQSGEGVGGSVNYFNETTNGDNAQAYVSNGIAPAVWNLFAIYPMYCGEYNLYAQGTYPGTINTPFWEYEFPGTPVENLGLEYEDCVTYSSTSGGGAIPSASTRFAIMGNFPDSITLGSQTPFITQNGMPQMYVYNGTPSQVAVETATSVNPTGATATFPFPSALSQNAYSIAVVNQLPGGTFYPAGVNLLSIAGSQTIAGNPFGVSVGGQTDAYQGRQLIFPQDGPPQGVWVPISGTRYKTFPVVSLYSNNQVLINGTAVGVGENPTAVATYASEAGRRNI